MASQERKNLSVLHKDDDLLIINKPWDMCINGEDAAHPVTVATLLCEQFPEFVDPNISYGFRFPHQLDFATSGVLCIALNKASAREMTELFTKRKVKKQYLALVHGCLQEKVYHVNKSVGKDSSDSRGFHMCTEENSNCVKARLAETHVTVLKHGLYNGTLPISKLLLEPITGRRHQLRVHCLSLDSPIIGDYTYSGGKDNEPYRMMLHAWNIVLPFKEHTISITAPDPFVEELDKELTYES